jgi:hypothetical protein
MSALAPEADIRFNVSHTEGASLAFARLVLACWVLECGSHSASARRLGHFGDSIVVSYVTSVVSRLLSQLQSENPLGDL